MTIYEERKRLKAGERVELEVRRYYQNEGCPDIVFARGLGGCAGREPLLDDLSEKYCVTTFSPRGAGESSGRLTVENCVQDISLVVDDLSQERGRKVYGAFGHSMGGYAFARILGERSAVEKAVLLCPLLSMYEQNPSLISRPVKWATRSGSLPARFLDACFDSYLPLDFLKVNGQGFRKSDLRLFVSSLYTSPHCDNKLLSPTRVLLTGGSVFHLPISNLDALKKEWESLGAKVSVWGDLDHLISGSPCSFGGEYYSKAKSSGIDKEIKEFFG